jgi:uncharacterized membrane protein/protein-disulfide isomerase
MSSRIRNLLGGFSLLGLAASAAAVWVHYHLIRNPDYASFCDVNTTVSCKQAYLSAYGSIGGIPVALGGVLFFALVLILVWAARPGTRLRDSAATYVFALSTIGLAFVLYLAYASFFVLKEVCPICVTTYVAVIGIFIVSGRAGAVALSQLPGRALRDLGALVMSPLASAIAVLFVAGAASAVAFFPRPEERPVAQPIQPLPPDQRAELEKWFDLQPKVTVPFSADGAKVLIVKFNDYQCPPCRATYFAYEPVLAKYKDRPNDVKFLLKHFPLNAQCNPGLHNLTHPAACDAAAAAVMARSNGTFDKLTDWFFMHQDELSPSTVRQAADEIAGIKDFDARYPRAVQEVKADAAAGGSLGVDQTPTFFINGRKVPGVSAAALDALIDLELKRTP